MWILFGLLGFVGASIFVYSLCRSAGKADVDNERAFRQMLAKEKNNEN